jgi:glycosyltransferase involved in cell wall biosynthesis
MPRCSVTVIITVYNEEETIERLLDSLKVQSRQPDEIIIADAGSTDRTQEIIQTYSERGYPIQLLVEPGANRARGRNLAIRQAKGEVIASIDAGCQARSGWLESLVAPFEAESPPEVVSGFYQPEAYSVWEEAVGTATVPTLAEVNRREFLPSSRSAAFTRAAWERVGGYPEYVECAEDTAFDLALRRARCRFWFVPEALVSWRMKPFLHAVFRQFFRYARSDGELGHRFGHYDKALFGGALLLLLALLIAIDPRAALLLLPLAALYWWRDTARARRRQAEWPAALLAPVVNLTVDFANLFGYLAGWFRRRPKPSPLPADRPLSFAQVTYTYQPISGGADVYAAQLADLIRAAGHQHTVYQRRAGTDDPEVRFVPNPLHGRPLEFWTHGLALFRLWREIASHDVVICHYPNYLLAVHAMCMFRRRPVRVAVSHGVFWDDAPRSLRSFLKALVTDLAFPRPHLYIANDTHFLRCMSIRIEPRQRMHSQIRPGVWFIPNAVDTGKFTPTEPRTDLPPNTILVPRALFRNRGIHLAVEAFALFRTKHLETTLAVVGAVGQPEYAAELRDMVADRGLDDCVLFRDPVPHDQLPGVYSAAELTLIPSLCGEGTSLSALESMACGTATICTYVAGLRDLPGPHALPMVVNLAEVMEQVWPERKRIGEEQRAQVAATYAIERWQETWLTALADAGARPLVKTEAHV